MNNLDKKVVVRFAPSPTGNLHIGSVRTALFNYLYAKHNRGRFILRYEDTDVERSKAEYEQNISDGLNWLGIKSDETYKQSQRNDIYEQYINMLLKKKLAYESNETGGNNKSVIRFKNPKEKITFNDEVRGEIAFETKDLGDFVIARNTREPLYNLAVVIDDFTMGITHCIRGEDHISNTPRQIMLQKALGFVSPIYAHIPLLLASDRSKLSKRHGAVAVTAYRDMGFLPQAITNYLALLGWNPGTNEEVFDVNQLIELFDLAKVQKGGAIFDILKLKWINKEHIKKESSKNNASAIMSFFLERTRATLKNKPDLFKRLLPTLIERIEVYSDITLQDTAGEFLFVTETPRYTKERLLWKTDTDLQVPKKHLSELHKSLLALPDEKWSNVEHIKDCIWDYASTEGRGSVLWPLRFALTGLDKSPDPFTVAYILGKEESLNRLNLAILL